MKALADSVYMGSNSFSAREIISERSVDKDNRYSLIRNDSEIDHLVTHAFECSLKRWPVCVPNASPGIPDVRAWRMEVHDLVACTENGYHRFLIYLNLHLNL